MYAAHSYILLAHHLYSARTGGSSVFQIHSGISDAIPKSHCQNEFTTQ